MSPVVKAFLKTLVFTVLVPGTVTVAVPYSMLPRGALSAVGPSRLLGLIPILAGAAGYLSCAWNFAFVGRGTPAPIDPPKTLVARGLHRFVRNPMYLAVGSIVLGEAIVFWSKALLIYGLGLCMAFHLIVVFYEEPALREKFGTSYGEYCRVVPRWFPRLRALKGQD